MSGLLTAILIPSAVLVGIAVIIYLVSRMREGGFQEISVHSLLVFYFYLVIVVSLIVTLVGLSTLIKGGLALALGPQFSYYQPPRLVPAVPAVPPSDSGLPPKAVPATPTPQEQAAQQQRALDANLRSDLLQGVTSTVIGGVVWILHIWGRRRVESEEEREGSLLNRAYLFLLLIVFSIVAIISAAQGVYETLRYYLIQPVDQFTYQSPPGSSLATAIVFVPVWIYYLSTLTRQWRRKPAEIQS